MTVSAHRVETRAELRTFIDLTANLAAARDETDHVVPLFAADISAWHRGSGWFAEAVELWLVRDDSGLAVGRMMCHRHRNLAERIAAAPPTETIGAEATDTLFFGALEAADELVLAEIIALILDRAHHLGATRVFGPVSPLPNVTGGLVTAGTEHPGFFDTAWNPNFFAPAFQAAGFAEWGPARTWEVRVDDLPHSRATAVTDAEWASRGLRRRPVTRLGLRDFAARMLPTLNSAFAALPYYTQISPAQLRSQMAGLSALLDPSLVVDIVGADDSDGAPSRCFALVIPDPIAVLRRHGGRLDAGAIWDLLRARGRLRDAVLIIQGTDPAFQGQGLLSLVLREVYAALAAGGYRRLRVTFIAEDNPASAAVFAKAGGRPLHSLCFLDKHLGDTGATEPEHSAHGLVDVLPTLIEHAARAPSAHNTQPWVPRIDAIAADGTFADLSVTVDPRRTLPVGDPHSEDLHLSLGCWVEALAIAAAEAEVTTAVTGVAGRGPALRIDIRLTPAAEHGSDGSDEWPRFTTGDLHHRQVDRGPLARDETAFAAAVDAINHGLEPARAKLVEIPEAVWSPLLQRASRFAMATPAIFAETLGWLRFDDSDPAYRQDGLTAECLRIPRPLARLAGLLNRRPLRPVIARAIAAALAPAGWAAGWPPARHRPDVADPAAPAPVSADRTGPAEPALAEPAPASAQTGAPHHVVLAVTEHTTTRDSAEDAGREVALGRQLLRTWLLLDRAGLRVDVHSEIKDCPDTHAQLRRFLTGTETTRPLATFSIGRSMTPVPRSHRRRPPDMR